MKPLIQSVQNQQIKQVAKLRDASTRRASGYFIIDGSDEVARAIAAGIELDCIYFSEDEARLNESLFAELNGDQLQPVSSAVMRKLAYGERDSGLIAVAKGPSLDLQQLRLPPQALLLILDSIEKPGNLGACMRTAAATGAHAVILTNPICDVFNPNAVRASRGSLFSVPVAVATPEQVVRLCERLQIELYTARVDGQVEFWEADFKRGAAIVLGNEASGLDDSWRGSHFKSLQIPMRDVTDSLNVSISAAVMLYEAVRQRREVDVGPRN